MDNRPIGVFDSGLGGLSAVKEIMSVLPGEDIIYFGDTSRVPYGTRSKETIIKYAKQDIRFLLTYDVKTIVIACGTVSAVAFKEAKADCPINVLGVVESAVAKAYSVTKNNIIGVLGTPATIGSGAYERALLTLNPDLIVVNNPCPLFVPLVENGYSQKGNGVIELVAEEYLAPLKSAGVDTIILGCTHYPLLYDVIYSQMGDNVTLIDPGKEVARLLSIYLRNNDMLSSNDKGEYNYFVSDSTENFTKLGSMFLNSDIEGSVERIDIEKI